VAREVFYACARPVEKGYWFLFRPYRPGAKSFIFHEGKVLLVRLGYGHKKWVLPGGGIERGETPEMAAVREAKEESGVVIANPVYIGQRDYNNQYKKVTVFYFTAEIANRDLVIDGQEIVDAGWFSLEALPREVAGRVPEEVVLYNNWNNE
jgi:ADP-ribose pyrophosphatase YjhB (NUDIX family)